MVIRTILTVLVLTLITGGHMGVVLIYHLRLKSWWLNVSSSTPPTKTDTVRPGDTGSPH